MRAFLLLLLFIPFFAGAQVTPTDYSNPDNWASNHQLGKYLPFDPSYTIVDPDTTVHTVVNKVYDTLSNFDVFYVYPTQPNSGFLGPAHTYPYWNTPDSIDPIIRMQVTQYGVFGRIYAPYYRQAALPTFISPTVSMEDQAKTLDTANTDVIEAFTYYMENFNNGKNVILVGHSQGSIMLHQMIRKFEQNLAQYQPYLDKICVSSLGGYGGPTVAHGTVAGGWTENYPICQYPEDVNCIMTWQCYKHTANIQTILPYAHIHNDSLVSMGYRYAEFDTLTHYVLLDSLGYSSTQTIPLMVFPGFHPDYGLHYSGITTDFVAYENMYEAYYESSSTGAGLKLKRIFQLGDKRKSPFPLIGSDYHSFDHSCFSGDVIGLIEYKLGLHVGMNQFSEIIFNVFPNPVSDILTVDTEIKGALFTIRDVYGREITTGQIQNNGKLNIDVSELTSGTYFYILKSEAGRPIKSGKFVVKH